MSIIFVYLLLTSFAFRIPRGAHFIRPRATVAARLIDNFCAAKIMPNQEQPYHTGLTPLRRILFGTRQRGSGV